MRARGRVISPIRGPAAELSPRGPRARRLLVCLAWNLSSLTPSRVLSPCPPSQHYHSRFSRSLSLLNVSLSDPCPRSHTNDPCWPRHSIRPQGNNWACCSAGCTVSSTARTSSSVRAPRTLIFPVLKIMSVALGFFFPFLHIPFVTGRP